MRYIAAVLLLRIAGVTDCDSAAVVKVLESAGVQIDEERIDNILSQLKGKDINTLIAEGIGKLSSVPSGGAAGGGGGAPAAAASGAAPAEEPKEEKPEEKEESDEDMGFGLFD